MEFKENIKFLSYLKTGVNWKLLFIIFLFQFLPTLYKTARIYFLGTLPDENTFNIASQVLWLSILYEIIIESIVIPLFFVFSKIREENKENNKEFGSIFTFMSIIIFLIYLIFTLIIYANVENILSGLIINDNNLFNKSSDYIKLEVWGIFLYSIFSYLFLAVTIFRMEKYLLISFLACIFYTSSSLLLDLFLISNFNFSLKLSVNGIGINSIIVNSICSITFIIYLFFKRVLLWKINFSNLKIQQKYLKKYFILFLISCIEVSVRNLCFYFMIIQPINALNSSGIYWITNNFIWSWLLLPISTISVYIKETFIILKREDDIEMNNFKNEMIFYNLFITCIVLIWLTTIPVNWLFIKEVMGIKNEYQEVSKLTSILIPFYIAFAYSNIIDSIFIKEGKISFYCIQSIIVNLTVYPVYFILWKLNIWIPTLNSISIMFGVGMLVHFIIDIPLLFLFLKQKQFKFRKTIRL
ncbi:MAG: hypothetical protein HDR43_02390 [Mycoplasma sp.]|nr:hypothetical protein [Mycoplasma sp.]